MKKKTYVEIGFGLFALSLIYVIIASNASITGFVTSPQASVSLVAPQDDEQVNPGKVQFMFKYPYEFNAAECSLLLNQEPAKTTNALLSSRDTRISMDLVQGTYYWSVECVDNDDFKLASATRKLVVGEQEESKLRITAF